jgi:hypothetical protein
VLLKSKTMKKTLLTAFASLFVGGLAAQTLVSTSPQNKVAIVEEFTGKTCGYCPDGHKRVDELIANNPGKVIGINIHAGSYASGTPNYRCSLSTGTDYGATLYGYPGVNLTGFPAGTVNRRLFTGHSQNTGNPGTAMSRGSFATTAATVFGEVSPVNVGIKAMYDPTIQRLYVTVEAYYTANEANAINKLTIGIGQDEIWGPQSGGSTYYSEMYDASKAPNSYKHMKMLRAILTGQWGDDISTTSSGSLFSQVYTYDLPAKIGDVDTDPTTMWVYAIVAQDEQTVLSGAKAKFTIATGQVDPNNPDNVLSVEDNGTRSNMSLFPNPTSGSSYLTVNASTNEVLNIRLINTAGAEVSAFAQEVNAGFNQVKIDLSQIKAGYYFVEVNSTTGVERMPLVVK